jgi:hypothetical protein
MTRMLGDSRHLAKSNTLHHLGRHSAIYQVSRLGLGGKPGRSSCSSPLQGLTNSEAVRIVATMLFMRKPRIHSRWTKTSYVKLARGLQEYLALIKEPIP